MDLLFALPALAFAFLIILMITCADTIVKLQLPEDHGNPPKPSLLPELNRISGDPHFRTFSYFVLAIEFAYLIIAVAFDDREWDRDLLLLEAAETRMPSSSEVGAAGSVLSERKVAPFCKPQVRRRGAWTATSSTRVSERLGYSV
jgi:hypothetical protein